MTLVVSRGPREGRRCRTSSARTRDEAERLLEDAGLQVAVTEREDADKEPGTVLAQDPGGGHARSTKGATVKLTVAKAPPQVDGARRASSEDATTRAQALEDAGLQGPRTREQTVDTPDEDGVVHRPGPAGRASSATRARA